MGLVDLHSHLLWALDDGCETPEETLAAARVLAALGFERGRPDAPRGPRAALGRPRALRGAARRGAGAARREGIAAHAPRERREQARRGVPRARGRAGSPRHRADRPVGARRGPFRARVPALPALVDAAAPLGVRPLLAHPERCAEFERPGAREEVVRLGAALQLNLGALAGLYGPTARKLAERFLDDGLYAVAATDLHRPEGAEEWLAEALDALESARARGGGPALRREPAAHPRRRGDRVKRLLQTLAGLAVSGLALWLTLRGKDLAAIWAEMRQADYRYLAPYLLILAAIHLCKDGALGHPARARGEGALRAAERGVGGRVHGARGPAVPARRVRAALPRRGAAEAARLVGALVASSSSGSPTGSSPASCWSWRSSPCPDGRAGRPRAPHRRRARLAAFAGALVFLASRAEPARGRCASSSGSSIRFSRAARRARGEPRGRLHPRAAASRRARRSSPRSWS